MTRVALVMLLCTCSPSYETAASAAHASRAALFVTAEVPLGEAPVPGPAHNQQETPRAAFDGTQYLVVWADTRSSPVHRIWAARVGLDAGVLDPYGIPITPLVGHYTTAPDVAFAGSHFLVVWSDNRQGPRQVRGARVDGLGNVEPERVIDAPAGDDRSLPRIASNGAQYLVTSQGARSSAHLLSASGAVLAEADLGTDSRPVPFFDGTTWQVVTRDPVDLRFRRFDPSLAPLGPDGGDAVLRNGEQTPLQYVRGDEGGMVVFRDSNTSLAVGAVMVAFDGGVSLDASFSVFQSAAPAANASAVSFDGGFLVVWNESGVVRGARITTVAGVLDPAGYDVCATANLADTLTAVSNGAGGLALVNATGVQSDIEACPLSPGQPQGVVSPQRISASGRAQVDLSVAINGRHALAAWEDWIDGQPQLRVAVLGPDGHVQSAGLPVANNAARQLSPAIAAGPSDYFVTWERQQGFQSDVMFARVGLDASVTPELTIRGGPGDQVGPLVVAVDGGCVVAWANLAAVTELWVSARDPAGALILDTLVCSVAATARGEVNLASSGDQALLTWQDDRLGDLDIWASRLSPNGAALDPNGFLVAGGPGAQTEPEVVFDGQNYLVLVLQGTSTGIVRVARDGGVLDAAPIPMPAFFSPVPMGIGEVLGMAVKPDGGTRLLQLRLDGGAQQVLDIDGDRPALASLGGRTWCVYQRHDPAAGGVYRAFGRQLRSLPDGESCSTATECETGQCTGSMCGPGGAGGGSGGGAGGVGGGTGGSASPGALSVGCACAQSPSVMLLVALLWRARQKRKPTRFQYVRNDMNATPASPASE